MFHRRCFLKITKMASPSPSPSKLTSPAKTPNPAKKRRVDNLTDIIKSTGDDFDTQITSCLYHMGKRDITQATKILEKVRRLMKATNAQYILKLNEINREMSALHQKVDGLEKRETYQSRRIADLQSKIENYKSLLSFDEDFATDEVESSDLSTHSESMIGSQIAEVLGTSTKENPLSPINDNI